MSDSLREQLQISLGASYTLERELIGGGMSRVFVARDEALARLVVVKVLSPELTQGLSSERFAREIKLAAALQEPHIVPVLAAGQTADGLPYYSMPFVEGESLRQRLRTKPPTMHEAVSILRDVLHALQYAHQRGVVHRDIKPENVLLSGSTAVVTDFGIAKAVSASKTEAPGGTITVVGTSLGTPAYMAPEQVAADPDIDHRADLYAWGIMAYELLAGVHPFADRKSPQQLLAAQMSERPVPLASRVEAIPKPLSALVMHCLEKERERRPPSAEAALAALDDVQMQRGRRVPRSRRTVALVATGVVLALGVGALVLKQRGSRSAASAPVVTAAVADSALRTVAVLPFVNIGGDSKDEYFSDGMTDELAHALAQLPSLQLAGRTSSYAFKGKSVSPQEIGKALDVAGVIAGTVRRAGDRLRVSVELTSTTDGKVRWSHVYESSATDVFQVQDEFTKAIVAALAPTLSGKVAATTAEARRGTADGEAYDLYLRGRYFWARRGAANLARAIDYFHRAIARDARFARAHAGLAMTYALLPLFAVDPADSLSALAVASATRALAIDSTIADAHVGLGYALLDQLRFEEADKQFRAAIALEPSSATAHQWHGGNLRRAGRLDESIAAIQRAAALDPLSAAVANSLASVFFAARRYPEAVAAGHRAIELDSTSSLVRGTLGMAYAFNGMPDSAVAMLEPEPRQHPGFPGARSRLAFAYAATGRWSDAARLRAELARPEGGTDPARAAESAIVELVFGNREPLLRALKQPSSARQVHYALFGFGCDPVFDPLRSEPRFIAVMKRYGVTACPAIGRWPIPTPPR